MQKLLILVGIVLFLTGCATVTANYQAKVSAWQGKTEQALVQHWGYPDKVIRSSDGNAIYVYQYRDSVTFPEGQNPGNTRITTKNGQTIVTQTPPKNTKGTTYHYQCTTWFEINDHGVIVKTSFHGNRCRAD